MSQSPPDILFYYAPSDTILHGLREGKLPWYSPASLDGVTELNHQSQLLFDQKQVLSSATKYACSLIFGPSEPSGETPVIAAIRRWRSSGRFQQYEEAEVVLAELCSKLIDQRFAELDTMMSQWFEACAGFRMLSLYERADNFLLWHRRADCLRGLCLGLRVSKDAQLRGAKALRYENQRPEITTLKEQIATIFYNKKVQPLKNMPEKFSNKAPAFMRDKEWRCYRQEAGDKHQAPADWITQVPFNPEAIASIGLGPAMPAAEKEAVLRELEEQLPNTKVTDYQFARSSFELQGHTIERKSEA